MSTASLRRLGPVSGEYCVYFREIRAYRVPQASVARAATVEAHCETGGAQDELEEQHASGTRAGATEARLPSRLRTSVTQGLNADAQHTGSRR